MIIGRTQIKNEEKTLLVQLQMRGVIKEILDLIILPFYIHNRTGGNVTHSSNRCVYGTNQSVSIGCNRAHARLQPAAEKLIKSEIFSRIFLRLSGGDLISLNKCRDKKTADSTMRKRSH